MFVSLHARALIWYSAEFSKVLKPWCWYCERELRMRRVSNRDRNDVDQAVLLQHQKSKHFKCQMCPRKLNVSVMVSRMLLMIPA